MSHLCNLSYGRGCLFGGKQGTQRPAFGLLQENKTHVASTQHLPAHWEVPISAGIGVYCRPNAQRSVHLEE